MEHLDVSFLKLRNRKQEGTAYLALSRYFCKFLLIYQDVNLCLLSPSVFVTLTCAFRYGREDLDVLGLTFRKDLFVANIQAFPPLPEEKKSLTRLQERLIKKLGEHAHPFTFEVLSLQTPVLSLIKHLFRAVQQDLVP